ncbi:hypothetical protein D6777_01660 [Candidatus Woesearchaeota archaeon]|nr:MAG: hypothetical protein D6777_01660 [Candidatus Woesearchaeota archaeon]
MSLLNKIKKPVVALTLAANACVNPQGKEVEMKADGIISVQEKRDLKRLIYEWDIVDENNLFFRMFVNDQNEFVRRRLKQRNLKWKGLDGVFLDTVKDRKGLEGAYEHCTMGEELPDSYGAFNCYGTREIVMVEGDWRGFINTFDHELGHDFNQIDGKKDVSEFPAEANRLYMIFNRIALDRDIGFMLSNYVFNSVPKETFELKIGDIDKYNAAALGFFLAGNKFNGDLDLAANYIFNASENEIRRFFNNEMKKHDGQNAQQVWFDEVEKLLYSKGFKDYMAMLIQRNSDKERKESDEVIDYFKLRFLMTKIQVKHFNGYAVDGLQSKKRVMLEDLLRKGQNYGFYNKRLRNLVVNELTKHYYYEAVALSDTAFLTNPQSLDVAIEKFEKILKLNEIFPCEFDEFECTETYSNPRELHLNSFIELARAYNLRSFYLQNKEDKDNAVDVVYAFLDKFYPIHPGAEVDYSAEKNGVLLTAKLLDILSLGYVISINKYRSYNDEDALNDAKYFMEIYQRASCQNIKDEDLMKECYAMHPKDYEDYMNSQ